MKSMLTSLLLLAMLVACGAKEESSTTGSTLTISGTINSNKSMAPAAVDLSTLRMYCVAFNANATSGQSDFGTDGGFAVAGIPANTPFGCFVVKKADSAVVATLKVTDTNTGMSNRSASSMSLGQSVNMGNLTLTEGSAVITVPKDRIAVAESTVAPAISVENLHSTSWTLSCVDIRDTACAAFVNGSPSVHFRILRATKSGQNIHGIGIWSSQAAFTGCGGRDMSQAEADKITAEEAGDFEWVQNSRGDYVTDTDLCPLREYETTHAFDTIQEYYLMEKLVAQGSMFTVSQENEWTEESGACAGLEKFTVTFSPSSATVMFGSFDSMEIVSGTNCVGTRNEHENFVVRFTKN